MEPRPRREHRPDSASSNRVVLDDEAELFPDVQKPAWWEVWLRVGQDRDGITATFESYAESIGIRTQKRRIKFSDAPFYSSSRLGSR